MHECSTSARFLKRYFPLMHQLLIWLLHSRHRRRIIYRTESSMQKIRVIDKGDLRMLQFGEGNTPIQASILLKHPYYLTMNCSCLMLSALFLNPQPKKILIIGLGAGVLSRSLAYLHPQAEITNVEYDPMIAEVAKTYFQFTPTQQQRIVIEEGRQFVEKAAQENQHYDLIMLDAFDSHYIPLNLMTQEFLQSVKSLLTPEGVLAANTFSISTLYDRESATYTAVFGQFYNVKFYNRIILAKNNALPSLKSIHQTAQTLNLKPLGLKAKWLTNLFTTIPDWNPKALPLRDPI